MKKHLILALALFTTLNLRGLAATPEAEAQFTAEAKAAFDTKDSTKLLGLVCWDDVTPEVKTMLTEQLSFLVRQTVTQIELIAPDPQKKFEYTRNGVAYKSNLAVIDQLKVTIKVEKPLNSSSAAIPVGEKGGKLFIATTVPVK
jgi:hypothetical protein